MAAGKTKNPHPKRLSAGGETKMRTERRKASKEIVAKRKARGKAGGEESHFKETKKRSSAQKKS